MLKFIEDYKANKEAQAKQGELISSLEHVAKEATTEELFRLVAMRAHSDLIDAIEANADAEAYANVQELDELALDCVIKHKDIALNEGGSDEIR